MSRRRRGLTNVELWRMKVAQEAHERGRRDEGALLPCGFCGEHHVPGRCQVADDSAEEAA